MANDNLYLIIDVIGDREISLMFFSGEKEKQQYTITPPDRISETFWKQVTNWLPTKKEKQALSGIGYRQQEGVGSYSTIRTLLSMSNTLGIIDRIPLVVLKQGEGIEKVRQESRSGTVAHELQPLYT